MTDPDFPARVRRLRDLYATLPKLRCKGLCANACRTRIDMSATEWTRLNIVVDAPEWMRRTDRLVCPVLTGGNRCGAYGVRPMICRLWGLSLNPALRCHHGCEPDRWLADVEVMEALFTSYDIGGLPASTDDPEDIRRARQAMRDPELAAALSTWIAGQADRRPATGDDQ